MFSLRAMTGFAGDVRVPSKLLLIDDVGVTSFADFVTGEGWCPGGDLGDGVAAIVTVLAETLGDDRGAEDDEKEQRQQHHSGETNEMFDVLEHDCLSESERGSASGSLRHVIWDTGECLGGR